MRKEEEEKERKRRSRSEIAVQSQTEENKRSGRKPFAALPLRCLYAEHTHILYF